MKKVCLLLCLMVASLAAQAQFEKGKWIINPSVSGLDMAYDTDADRFSFGAAVKGGCFLVDNFALLVQGGVQWNDRGTHTDIYRMGVGTRYYFSKIGIYVGADVNVDRHDYGKHLGDDTKFSFGMDAGYAFFLSRTVTLEPAFYWNVDEDRHKFGLKLGFGFYF